MEHVREDNSACPGVGLGGAGYSLPRRGDGVRRGEYAPGPPPSSVTTTTASKMVPARLTGTPPPAVSAPPPISDASGEIYERGEREQHERE